MRGWEVVGVPEWVEVHTVMGTCRMFWRLLWPLCSELSVLLCLGHREMPQGDKHLSFVQSQEATEV